VQFGIDRVGKDQRYFLDCTTSHELLGWRAHVGLDQGLTRVVNWVSENLETLKYQPLDYVLRK
jgi:dTDP-glucose 4,6-dehydratase